MKKRRRYPAKRKMPPSLYLWVVIPVILQMFIYLWGKHYFYTHIFEEPVKIGRIHHRGVGDVELWGVYGDAFAPKDQNTDFDVVVVSATINPLAVWKKDKERIIVWQQNNLLHSALVNTFPDKEVFRKAVEEMVISMGQNGQLIKYFLDPQFQFKDSYHLKDFVHVYYWEVPNGGVFHAKTGINAIVAVPIFDPAYVYKEGLQNLEVLHARLQDNVFLVIRRAVETIEDWAKQKPHSIHTHTIAIPALAGTCCRLDSALYLDYSTSFFTILRGLEESKLPNTIERVYLISYDKLPDLESRISLQALFRVFSYYHLRYWMENKNLYLQGPILRALIWILPFWLMYVCTHRRGKQLLKSPRSRLEFLAQSARAASIYSGVAIPINEFLLEGTKGDIVFLLMGDLFFGIVSVYALAWLNNR